MTQEITDDIYETANAPYFQCIRCATCGKVIGYAVAPREPVICYGCQAGCHVEEIHE